MVSLVAGTLFLGSSAGGLAALGFGVLVLGAFCSAGGLALGFGVLVLGAFCSAGGLAALGFAVLVLGAFCSAGGLAALGVAVLVLGAFSASVLALGSGGDAGLALATEGLHCFGGGVLVGVEGLLLAGGIAAPACIARPLARARA